MFRNLSLAAAVALTIAVTPQKTSAQLPVFYEVAYEGGFAPGLGLYGDGLTARVGLYGGGFSGGGLYAGGYYGFPFYRGGFSSGGGYLPGAGLAREFQFSNGGGYAGALANATQFRAGGGYEPFRPAVRAARPVPPRLFFGEGVRIGIYPTPRIVTDPGK